MADGYISEVRVFAFSFTPVNWMPCNGQLLQVASNMALKSLLGYTYGGSGGMFNLPDLRGRAVRHANMSTGAISGMGKAQGSETVVLQPTNMPYHAHQLVPPASVVQNASATNGNVATPSATQNTLGVVNDPLASNNNFFYNNETPDISLNVGTPSIASAGQGQPMSIMQPFVTCNMCICVMGVYPQRD